MDTPFCPKCKSTHVKLASSIATTMLGLYPKIEKYQCLDCHFTGLFPVIHQDNVEAMQKDTQ